MNQSVSIRSAEMRPNEYTCWAEYYDKDPRSLYCDDIDFYKKRAAHCDGPVLELGCGTGRVAMALALAGSQVTGLDHSSAMLRVFRKKLEAQDKACQSRIDLIQGDMSRFSIGRQFSLILIPFRSFQALTTRTAQRECLACVKQHLIAGGKFIFNVFYPKQRLDSSWAQPEQLDWAMYDEASMRNITRYSTRKAIDTQRQVLDIDMKFVIADASGQTETFSDSLKLAYFYEDQLTNLVQNAGFRVSEKLGYYDGTPVSIGNEMIFVCDIPR